MKKRNFLKTAQSQMTPQLKSAILILSKFKPNLCWEDFDQDVLIESAKELRTAELEVLRSLYGQGSEDFLNGLFDRTKQPIFDDNSMSDDELLLLSEAHECINKINKDNERYCLTLVKLRTGISI